MNSLKLLISEKTIKEQLLKVSSQLSIDYHQKQVVLIMVMKGALFFVADLMRLLDFATILELVSASSYGKRGSERGSLMVRGLQDIQVSGKHVLVIDDVFHSGHTLSHIISELKKQNPESVKSLVLLFKQIARDISYTPDYYLFKIENNPFVVGYGMDYKEQYRGLPDIYILEGY
jgi:hypoxanthine phosphoribosyltransferase